MNKILATFSVFLFLFTCYSCESKKSVKKHYFEGGAIQSQIELNGKDREGKMTTYFKDGKIESVSNWKSNKVDGQVIHYYSNGQKELESIYRNGIPNGKSYSYYPNGAIHKDLTYTEGKLVGEALFYSEEGRLYEKDIYDSEGSLMYVLKLDDDGYIKEEIIVPIVKANRDTISQEESFTGKIYFGFKISGNLKLLTGTPDSTGKAFLDTVYLEKGTNNIFKFSVEPHKLGSNVFAVVAHYEPVFSNDTLAIALHGAVTTYPYFVKKKD